MSTPQNSTVKLTNGRPVLVGTVSAVLTQSVQFVIPEPCRDFQGFCIVQGAGGSVTGTITGLLEGSLDGGNTWFGLNTSATIVLNATLLTGEVAANSADAFQVNGMGAGTLFRFGYTGSGTINTPISVWALVG